jgi:hypothetical protein
VGVRSKKHSSSYASNVKIQRAPSTTKVPAHTDHHHNTIRHGLDRDRGCRRRGIVLPRHCRYGTYKAHSLLFVGEVGRLVDSLPSGYLIGR